MMEISGGFDSCYVIGTVKTQVSLFRFSFISLVHTSGLVLKVIRGADFPSGKPRKGKLSRNIRLV